jgi:hypothetical protein
VAENKTTELAQWITRIQKASSAKEVFATLEEFRPGPWTHEDRSKVAKAYIRVLERVGVPATQETLDDAVEGNDGPVWYEKM